MLSIKKWFYKRFRLLILFLLPLIGLTIMSCTSAQDLQVPELIAPITAEIHMDTAAVTRGSIVALERYTGIVRAPSEPIGFGAVSGIFLEGYVLPGDSVYQGQLLARLDFTHMERQIYQLETQLSNMHRNNSIDNELRTIDIELQVLSLNMLDGAEAELLRLEIEGSRLELRHARERQALTIRHIEEDIEALRRQLPLTELTAPFDGIITFSTNHSPGSWVAPFTSIFHISPADAYVFIEYIDSPPLVPDFAARVTAHVGDRVYDVIHLRPSGEEMHHYSNQPIRFERHSRLPIRFILDADYQPPLGTFVSLHVYSLWEDDVLRIHPESLIEDPNIGFYVYRVENGNLVVTPISIGVRTETFIEVTSGLAEGDIVYVEA